MLEFLKSNEVKTLNDRAKKAGSEWTRQCVQKGGRSVLDFTAIENGNSKETGVHVCMYVCAADVGSTDHCLMWTESQQTRVIKNKPGRQLHRWRLDKVEVKEKQREFQEEMTKNAEHFFSELMERTGTTYNRERSGERDRAEDRILEGTRDTMEVYLFFGENMFSE